MFLGSGWGISGHTGARMDADYAALEHRSQASAILHATYADALKRLPSPNPIRLAVVRDACHLAIEHQGAVAALVRLRHYSSAFALIRPLMETTFRALWLLYVADYQSVRFLIADERRMYLDDLARSFTKGARPPDLRSLALNVLDQKGIFHSFAHADVEQLVRVRSGFDGIEVLTVLLMADMFAVIAGEAAALAHGDASLHALTRVNAPRLASEMAQLNPESPRPPGDWTGELPPRPVWPDPT